MKITQIRNATVLIETAELGILVDPMFAPKGAIPSLKYATRSRRRNPLVELPENFNQLKSKVTCCLITHCQKGHFDHLDRAAVKWLRDNDILVYCSTQDAKFLSAKGLNIKVLDPEITNPIFGGAIRLIPCTHGKGFIGSMMAHGYGYFLELPGEPSLYLAGDTILTQSVEEFIKNEQPDITLIPAGGARMDLGGEIIMGLEEAVSVGELANGKVIANHLEALDHCPVSRISIFSEVQRRCWEDRYFIPQDGESISIKQAVC